VTLVSPPLHEVHEAAGADFTDFGGWNMPVTFDGIRQEHTAVRESVGVFDVSHMSEVVVEGPDAAVVMDGLTTNDIGKLQPGDAQYSCILDDNGIILDDTVVYRYPDQDGYLFVPNAGHGEQMTDRWINYADQHDLDVTVTDVTNDIGLLAIQGPEAVPIVDEMAEDSVEQLDRFSCTRTIIADVTVLVARTGYTGEDGVEVFFDADESQPVWKAFDQYQACGLGARDTLRLEAGLLLSGQDFDPEDEPRTPLEAGLGFVVDLSKGEFNGRDALIQQKQAGPEETMVGIKIEDRGIARHGYAITKDGAEIGHVTSGTMSPTFGVPLALGYVTEQYADFGTSVSVRVRGDDIPATIVDQRFLSTLEDEQLED